MRRLLKLAILMALGGWALKRLSELDKESAHREGVTWWDEEDRFQPQPLEDYRDASESFSMTEEADLEPQTTSDLATVEAEESLGEQAHVDIEAVDEGSEEAVSSPEESSLETAPAVDAFVEGSSPDSDKSELPMDGVPAEDAPWDPGEEAPQVQSAEAGEPEIVKAEDPLDFEAARKHRRERARGANGWSLPVAPGGEEKLRKTREEVDERLRNLPNRKKDEGTAA